MRFTPSKVNDGKILVFVDLSEINYKPLPTRSPAGDHPITATLKAASRCRPSWPRSEHRQRVSVCHQLKRRGGRCFPYASHARFEGSRYCHVSSILRAFVASSVL
jgi:hypothetical protein